MYNFFFQPLLTIINCTMVIMFYTVLKTLKSHYGKNALHPLTNLIVQNSQTPRNLVLLLYPTLKPQPLTVRPYNFVFTVVFYITIMY